jgi:hypothetical protein
MQPSAEVSKAEVSKEGHPRAKEEGHPRAKEEEEDRPLVLSWKTAYQCPSSTPNVPVSVTLEPLPVSN